MKEEQVKEEYEVNNVVIRSRKYITQIGKQKNHYIKRKQGIPQLMGKFLNVRNTYYSALADG
jgi:hypothetical protein